MEEGSPHRNRFLLKFSGELLAGTSRQGIDPEPVRVLAEELVSLVGQGYRPGVVVGGGNFLRGRDTQGITRTTADYMGMLATILNALALSDAVESAGGASEVLSAFAFPEAGVETFSPRKAGELLDRGAVAVYAGGTGNPGLSTDTAAALRAAQTRCDTLYKGTKVDGVYDRDPQRYPDARRIPRITWNEVLSRGLGVIDASAVAVCRDAGIRIVVFDVTVQGNFSRALKGELPVSVVEG